MSTTTIEQLQRIVADDNRTTEDRRQAAEHIIQLQEADKPAPIKDQEDEANQIKRVFAAILGDRSDSKQRQEEEDSTMRVCAYCFRLQAKENATCELCGEASWLIPSVAKSNPEQEMFIRMAAGYTIEQLKIALYSGWAAHTKQREQVARKLLASQESKASSTATS